MAFSHLSFVAHDLNVEDPHKMNDLSPIPMRIGLRDSS